ncbi:MAG: hypothetical protein FJ304_17380 [Planctomycetes bacterium]|nr:hypothetical protein [Planctomycetota bacterium]
MGWETRGGKEYYYRAVKINGRVVKTYVGTGAVGAEAARRDELARADRAREAVARHAERERLAEGTRLAIAVYELGKRVYAEAMTRLGCHFHNGEWRARRAARAPVDEGAATDARARAAAAREADERRFAGVAPVPVRPFTAPAEAVLEHEIAKVAGPDAAARAAVRATVEAKRAELAGPRPRFEVSLVADRAALLWVRYYRLDAECRDRTDPRAARARQHELTAALRNWLDEMRRLGALKDRQRDRDRLALSG